MGISRRAILAAGGLGALTTVLDPVGLLRKAGDTAEALTTPPPVTTLERTLVRQDLGNGYFGIGEGPGEPHIVRRLFPSGTPPQMTKSLIAFAQMSDMQIIDQKSPMRVEYLDEYDDYGAPHFNTYGTDSAYRPHEMLSAQLTDSMCRAIQRYGKGPVTGLPLRFTLVTGDAIDNCQYNETRWYINLLDGKSVEPDSGIIAGADQSVSGGISSWGPVSRYWIPSASSGQSPRYTHFPQVPGLIDASRRRFTANGVGMPWYAAIGNHDLLVQGNADLGFLQFFREELVNGIATGSSKITKATGLPDKLGGTFSTVEAILSSVLTGDFSIESHTVAADPNRRLLSKAQFINEHFKTASTPGPVGHGFTSINRGYYAIPSAPDELFQFICLDTVDDTSFGADGVIDDAQFAWLETQLKACSSRYRPDLTSGTFVTQPTVRDKLVVLFCHHTIATMTKDSPGKHGPELRDLLLRFPNVIMLVNGHTHANNLWPHSIEFGTGNRNGFWEVNTASHIDWPVQSRLIEVSVGSGMLSIFTTMIDADAPLRYAGDISTPVGLASLARELATNDPQEVARGIDKRRDGEVTGTETAPHNRNAQLLIPAPFPIENPPPRVAVPDVRGATQSAATTSLTAAGLTVGTIGHTIVNESIDNGKVMSQNPGAGASVPTGTPINLVLGQWNGNHQ